MRYVTRAGVGAKKKRVTKIGTTKRAPENKTFKRPGVEGKK